MAGITRVHGATSTGTFYSGYKALCIKITDSSSNFTADTLDSNGNITAEGGYAKMVKAVQQFGSINLLGLQANGAFCCVVDEGSFNAAGDSTNTGWAGALKTAATAAANAVGTAGTIAITSGTVFTSTGVFTLG